MSVQGTSAGELREWVSRWLAAWLGVPLEAVDGEARFSHHGLDSAGATRLVADLAGLLGRSLPPTLVWDHPTPELLVRYLVGQGAPAVQASRADVPRPPSEEPIALVGMACRFPGGAEDPGSFWRLLCEERDAVTEVPASRWDVAALYDADPASPGRMSTRWGGFLEQVDGFEPDFFGISPKEAVRMDPQQRLMLELSWEALEDAGLAAGTLRESPTGVFFGAMWNDYARLPRGLESIAQHTATGQDLSLIPARVSYTLGLQGPSLAVNTACSSSLVAIHLACQALRTGEATLALAGGVNLLLSPDATVAMSKFGGMAPDGRCKAFDARANGYVRGEGGGVVVLEPLSRALALGHPVVCVIRGSAVNNDGFSNGLTAPNPRAQEAVLRQAYARAGVDPRRVHYVEAHGTGTLLGDPIEARALGAVLGSGRGAERPLCVGSVKTNIGHLEAAAGVAGLIKVALALRHRFLPTSLHFLRPNPHIPFEALRLEVVKQARPWPHPEERALAGVSGFGFGGTNCHVVLEEWMAGRDKSSRAPPPPRPVPATRPGVVFVFPGQGGQWPGMGRELMQCEPAFRAALERCDEALQVWTGWSVLEELAAGGPRMGDIDVVQPVLFAVEVALAWLWRSWGVEPAAVVGHSMGEVAAAHVAGILGLEDAARIIRTRSRLLREARGRGAMVVVELPLEAARELLEGRERQVSIAASNSVTSTVLSGAVEGLEALVRELGARGVSCRWVKVDVASHSAQVEPLLVPLHEALAGVSPSRGTIPMVSTVTGAVVDGRRLGPAYWLRNLREPVLFAQAIERLGGEGYTCFLEVGPHPVLTRAVEEVLTHLGQERVVLGSLQREAPERPALLEGLARLHAVGQAVPGERRPAGADATRPGESEVPPRAQVLVLSAHTPRALRARAEAMRALLSAEKAPRAEDVCYTAALHREHLEWRLAVRGGCREELVEQLGAFLQDERRPGVASGHGRLGREARLAFVFSGQGTQWTGMGQRLLAREPAFRVAVERCDELFGEGLGWSVREALRAPEAGARLERTDVAQALLFTLQVGLAELWRSWGIVPDVVVGHSMGEVAAAHVAGALSLADAVRVILHRGRLLQRTAGQGKMLAVPLPRLEAEALVAEHPGLIEVGALNGPCSTVLTGDGAVLESLHGRLGAQGRRCHWVSSTYAFHSARMVPVLGELVDALAPLRPGPTRLPLISTVTGGEVAGWRLDADYWARNVREPVRFAEAMASLSARGRHAFVELAPHPTLGSALVSCLGPSTEEEVRVLPSLARGQDDRSVMLATLGALFTLGRPVDWRQLHPESGRLIHLPSYPWQRTRFWLPSTAASWGVDLESPSGRDEQARTAPGPTEDAPTRLVPLLTGCSAEKRRALLREFFARELAQLLGVRVETLDPGRSFLEMGMDSLMAIRFLDRLGQGLEMKLDAVLAFEFDCLDALCGHLDRKLERTLLAVA
jgi:acyl transferase domain-containing protein/acyl carrier protein